MPAAAISCLHPQLKRIIEHEAASHIPDLAERQVFLRLIVALADCQGTLMGFEAPEQEGRGRTKRAPSQYNLHLKKCASSKAKGGEGKDFKTCAVEWRAAKAQQRRQ
jgi:hypothetical protein